MKLIHNTFKALAAVALTALAVGCSTDLKEKENLAVAAGFKIITPTKPDQVALLPTLPKNTLTKITYQGKLYYVFPDVKHNRAFVGGPAEFQAYAKLHQEKQISDQNLEAAQMNQMAAMNQMNWGAWGGWGGYGWAGMGGPMVGPMGMGYRR